MKRCRETFQYKQKRLQCEFEKGHKCSHYNEAYGCWPNPMPKTFNDSINRMVLLIGLCLAAGALIALIFWLVEHHP